MQQVANNGGSAWRLSQVAVGESRRVEAASKRYDRRGWEAARFEPTDFPSRHFSCELAEGMGRGGCAEGGIMIVHACFLANRRL